MACVEKPFSCILLVLDLTVDKWPIISERCEKVPGCFRFPPLGGDSDKTEFGSWYYRWYMKRNFGGGRVRFGLFLDAIECEILLLAGEEN